MYTIRQENNFFSQDMDTENDFRILIYIFVNSDIVFRSAGATDFVSAT